MTSPSRKSLPTTVLRAPVPTKQVDTLRCRRPLHISSAGYALVFGFLLCYGSLGINPQAANAQSQYGRVPPAGFQRPSAFRDLLGVRNSSTQQAPQRRVSSSPSSSNRSPQRRESYSRVNSQPQRSASTRTAKTVPVYPDTRLAENWAKTNDGRSPVVVAARQTAVQSDRHGNSDRNTVQPTYADHRGAYHSQPIGSGVRRASRNERTVDPIDDPFGDRTPSRPVTRRNDQESILRQPLNSGGGNTIRSSNRTFRQEQGGGFQAPGNAGPPPTSQPDPRFTSPTNPAPVRPGNTGGNLAPQNSSPFGGRPVQDPMNDPMQDPMNDPMTDAPRVESRPMNNGLQDPMNDPMQDPMNDPMQDPMSVRPFQENLRQQEYSLDCEEINGVMLQKSIRDISVRLKPTVEEGKSIPGFCQFEGVPSAPRCWQPQTFVWTASGICSKPLYFQHIQLERYGHSRGPIIQPILSVAHFFGNAAIYPYKAGIHPPNECMYALGYYRPGDCAPWLREPFPFSAKGAASQAISTLGYTGVFQ